MNATGTDTLDTVKCTHCKAMVADRPYPPPEDDAAWEQEAREHRLGCAAVLSRNGSRPSPAAPVWAHRDGGRHDVPEGLDRVEAEGRGP